MNHLKYLNRMKCKNYSLLFIILGLLPLITCKHPENKNISIRPLADTIGFAQYDWQMDSVIARINRNPGNFTSGVEGNPKVLICPHDDYAYVGSLYPETIKNIKAKTVFLFGVAHKASLMKLEDQIIFDSYDFWKGPYGKVKISHAREELLNLLPKEIFQVNDSMQRLEHSVEAIIPFLQYYNQNVEIISILVPYMSYDKMETIAIPLAKSIKQIVQKHNWVWGGDYAMVISSDAVHYGDEDWGGKNFARFGTDSLGYFQAMAFEKEISLAMSGNLTPDKIKAFISYTVNENDYKEYKWTWCGRYSIPLGLLTAYHLQKSLDTLPLNGYPIGYANSIDHPSIPVEDLGMGVTAPASLHHWVGYSAIQFH